MDQQATNTIKSILQKLNINNSRVLIDLEKQTVEAQEDDCSEDGHLVIKPKSATLDELLAHVTPDNLHKEVSTGEPQGRESW
ncbi:hypothetical protein ACFFNY_20505 [Paenibacillus hodogayensis]|uniref:AbrB/MazE/SpoVT family DNA-binding domain-containing protein n=1 Tax=Paenibacillus hodogayensis TaxID=279208 RepID=A0ABV5W078_9BACL